MRTKGLTFLSALLLGLVGVLRAFGDTLPDPLALGQALSLAEEHPRVRLGAEAAAFPRRQPLYLDCHHLAYSQLGSDDRRSRPLDALLSPLAAQQLEIMERFLDVLLADLSYARYNEAMAVAYIQYDRANVRRELGQFSELRVAELETTYQDVLRKRAASEASQRVTRALLAQAVARPGELPRNLVVPPLASPPAELPSVQDLLARRAETLASDEGASVGGDERERLFAMEWQQQVLELLQRLQALQAAARYADTDSFMRDLKLDESRTLYEQEVKADLGFSMSQQTRAHLQEQRVTYCRALAWAEINALLGEPVWVQTESETSP